MVVVGGSVVIVLEVVVADIALTSMFGLGAQEVKDNIIRISTIRFRLNI
jgi:hypothetical protein